MSKTLILCNCLGSQKLDASRISKACAIDSSKVFTALCTDQLGDAAALIQKGQAIIACRQEQVKFEELAEEIGAEIPAFVDIRDRAGWSDDTQKSGPKMAALVLDSMRTIPPAKVLISILRANA